MMAKIFAFLKRRWWVVLAAVVVGWGIYMFFTCYLWPDGNCTGFMGKTVWDVLQLLIIPVTLAVVAAYLDGLERKTDRENMKDNQREALLQSYIEFMTQMVLKEGLSESKEGDKVREIAQVKTDTTLGRLDLRRKEVMVKFLSSMGLVQGKGGTGKKNYRSVVILGGIDLSGAELEGIDLPDTDLWKANLMGANVHRADLGGADLSDADLSSADLSGADLMGANLSGANLSGADLSGTDLSGAEISDAILCDANFRDSNLSGADLYRVNLRGADLSGAILEGAWFDGARMPDGKEYDPKIHTVEMLTGHKKKLGVD